MKAVIIEDEELAANRLARMVCEMEPGAEIVSVIDTVKDAVSWISMHSADLIFLDIHLADGNAFEIFRQTEVQPPVIFTTAFDEYAIRAFKVNSIDYLLKPVNREELAAALEKYHDRMKGGGVPSFDVEQLIKTLIPEQTYQKRFMVYAGQKIVTIPTEQVAAFFSLEKDTYLETFRDRNYVVEYSLDQLQEMVSPVDFFRINRKLLISIHAIKEIYPMGKSRLKVIPEPDLGVDTMVSVHRTAAFRKWLSR